MSNKKIKSILLCLENEEGVIPANPKCYKIKAKEGTSIDESESKEKIVEHGSNGEASSPVYGASDFTVSLPLVLGVKNAALIPQLVYGEAVVTDTTAIPWSAALTVTAGDKVNHSDGVTTLVASNSGTTDSTEPTIPASPQLGNTTIADNDVIWYYSNRQKTYTGDNKPCLTTFTIELEEYDCIADVTSYRRARGTRVNSCPTGQTGSDTSYEMTLDCVATDMDDSNDPDTTYTPLSGMTPTIVDLTDDIFYNYKDSKFLIDDILTGLLSSYSVTTTRNATTENLLNQKKIGNIGTIDPSGTMEGYFDQKIWDGSVRKTDLKIEMKWDKFFGASYSCVNPRVKLQKANKQYSTDVGTKITAEVDAYGSSSLPSCQYVVVAPVTL